MSSIARSVGHVREPCKKAENYQDAIWGGDSGGPKEPHMGVQFPGERGNLGGYGLSSNYFDHVLWQLITVTTFYGRSVRNGQLQTGLPATS